MYQSESFNTGLLSSSIQLLSHVWLFLTPWTAACQASLSITNSWSLLSGSKFCLLIDYILKSSLTLSRGQCDRWLLLAFPELSANTCGGGRVCWFCFGSPHLHLEARNHGWLWHFLFMDMTADISLYCMRKSTMNGVDCNMCYLCIMFK